MNVDARPARRILIIPGDEELPDQLRGGAAELGWNLVDVRDRDAGLRLAQDGAADLLLLDRAHSPPNGYGLCRAVRDAQPTLPIIILATDADEVDRVLGLEMGADDYLTKPVGVRELIARMKAQLRRMDAMRDGCGESERLADLDFGPLVIRRRSRQVLVGGAPVGLTAREYDLLEFLACHPGRAWSREQLLDRVWGYTCDAYAHTVTSHVNRLRRKIEDDPARPRHIRTVRGYGYRFAERAEVEPLT